MIVTRLQTNQINVEEREKKKHIEWLAPSLCIFRLERGIISRLSTFSLTILSIQRAVRCLQAKKYLQN